MIRATYLSLILVAGPALGQTEASDPAMFTAGGSATALHATDLVGQKLFASPTEVRSDWFGAIPQDWVEVGVIEDLIVSRTGGPVALLLQTAETAPEPGRRIAVNLGGVYFPMDGTTPEDMTDVILVITASAASLAASPAFDGTQVQPPTDDTEAAQAPDRDGYVPVAVESLTPDLLAGADILGPDGSQLGVLADVRLDPAGLITNVIAAFGSGADVQASAVSLPVDQITVMRRTNSGIIRIYVDQATADAARISNANAPQD